MKKTFIALMALAGVAFAETLTMDTSAALSYEGKTALTTGNKLVTWSTETDFATLDSWYIEIKMVASKASEYDVMFESKGIRNDNNSLAVLVKEGSITLGNSSKTELDDNKSITFNADDVITLAYYDGTLYLGNTNETRRDYFAVSPSSGMETTLVSGTPRVWANGNPGSTPVGEATIYSLENLTIPDGEKLDMATLMKTGVAQTMLVPEPTTATLSLLALTGLAARRRRR